MRYLYLFTAILFLIPVKQVFSQRMSVDDYIQKNKDAAIYYMEKCGVPASVILGIAIHESAAGNSKIARHLNNHFGIKGPNNSKTIRSSYKGYPSVRASYADFVNLLQRRSRYNVLFDKGISSYSYWIKGIARAGYAMSNTWPKQVMAIIRKHRLDRWDHSSDTVHESHTVYRVKAGDTLFEIAQKFQTSVQALIHKNDLESTLLQVGQDLRI